MTISLRSIVRPLALAIVALTAERAAAQSAAPDRISVSVSGAYQLTASAFDDTAHPIDFGERATINTRYAIDALPGFEAGGAVRVWRRLGIGLTLARVSKAGRGAATAAIPHPLFFGRPRSVAGDAPGVQRTETSVNGQAVWTVPLTRRSQVGIAGGPSWFRVEQDLVQDIEVAQSYPFDTATFGSARVERQRQSRLGFHAGAAFDYWFSQHVGAGVGATYAHARIRLNSSDAGTIAADAGGGRVGGGIRLHF